MCFYPHYSSLQSLNVLTDRRCERGAERTRENIFVSPKLPPASYPAHQMLFVEVTLSIRAPGFTVFLRSAPPASITPHFHRILKSKASFWSSSLLPLMAALCSKYMKSETEEKKADRSGREDKRGSRERKQRGGRHFRHKRDEGKRERRRLQGLISKCIRGTLQPEK